MTTCSTCRFWQAIRDEWPDLGQCVRKAPSPQPQVSSFMVPPAVWPTTHESNWCGEWEARP